MVISSLDVSVTQQARDLFKLAQRMGPLGGVFHLAMVLSDRLFPNMVRSWPHARSDSGVRSRSPQRLQARCRCPSVGMGLALQPPQQHWLQQLRDRLHGKYATKALHPDSLATGAQIVLQHIAMCLDQCADMCVH